MRSINIQSLLIDVARSCPEKGLILPCPGKSNNDQKISYAQLLQQSRRYGFALKQTQGFQTRTPVLIYLEDQLDALLWFWAALFADLIPVMVPRMSDLESQRHKYIKSLDTLLHHPVWISGSQNQTEFLSDLGLNFLDPKTLSCWLEETIPPHYEAVTEETFPAGAEEDAIFMLTSGSTGAPKAVRLTHHTLLTSIQGKLSMREHPVGQPFLNWISLDHVASIVEIHLTAMRHEVDQVLVKAIDVISDPMLFLKLLSEHKVSRTFAPNFFLAKLLQSIQAQPAEVVENELDLQHLMWLGSGGEANDVDIGVALSAYLSRRGSRQDVLVPGFGMTETCAGAIYNMDCPKYDIKRGNLYTALGKCVPGIEMRISHSTIANQPAETMAEIAGDLEVRGDIVFSGYYNNPTATEEAFTPDGWFRTGDQAVIDGDGILNMTGRVKDTIIINGIKFFPQEIENVVSQTLPLQPSRIVCFPFRRPSAPTESICILYVLDKDLQTPENLTMFVEKITQSVIMHTGAIPQVIALADDSKLNVSSLGKVSRNKMRTLHEKDFFQEQVDTQKIIIEDQRLHTDQGIIGEAVTALLMDIHAVLNLPLGSIGPDIAVFEIGMTSIDIFRLKHRIEQRLQISVPLTKILSNPTARSMASALEDLHRGPSLDYDPVVTLRQGGTRAPLWLVHPGVGEVLVFLGLSKHLHDRPVYALRARGFDGQAPFASISETVATYCAAIKSQQPHGPYAIAGYSYGSMLAFEIAKSLQLSDPSNEIRFLGSFNLPPHIKQRMRQMDWSHCLLHLCMFLDLITSSQFDELSTTLSLSSSSSSNTSAFSHVYSHLNHSRLQTLSLDATGLQRWTQIAYGLQSMAIDYEPSGTVPSIDVFHAEPLKVAAGSRREWVENHLSRWRDFVAEEEGPRFHEVQGAHYTMLAPEFVDGFARTLDGALRGRGV